MIVAYTVRSHKTGKLKEGFFPYLGSPFDHTQIRRHILQNEREAYHVVSYEVKEGNVCNDLFSGLSDSSGSGKK